MKYCTDLVWSLKLPEPIWKLPLRLGRHGPVSRSRLQFVVTGRERHTTAQSEGCIPLPSADQQVQPTADISKEVFAAADRQFVE